MQFSTTRAAYRANNQLHLVDAHSHSVSSLELSDKVTWFTVVDKQVLAATPNQLQLIDESGSKTLSLNKATCAFYDETSLICASGDGPIRVFDRESLEVVASMKLKAKKISAITKSSEDAILVANSSIFLIDANGAVIKTFSGHVNPVKSLAFLDDAHFVSSAESDPCLALWNIEESSPSLLRLDAPIKSFNVCNNLVCVTCENGAVYLCSMLSHQSRAKKLKQSTQTLAVKSTISINGYNITNAHITPEYI
jgi:WD40 repeat protein